MRKSKVFSRTAILISSGATCALFPAHVSFQRTTHSFFALQFQVVRRPTRNGYFQVPTSSSICSCKRDPVRRAWQGAHHLRNSAR